MHPIWNALLGWGVALGVAVLFIGLGRSIARLLGERDCGVGVAFATGSWLVALLLMGCAMGPGTPMALRPGEVLVALGCCAPVAAWGLRGLILRGAVRFWRRRTLWLPMWLVALLLLLWFTPFLVQTLLPDTDWDAAMYHRPTAVLIAQQGITATDPYRAQINFPALVPLFYAGFMTCGLPEALTPFNMVVALLTAWTTYDIGRRHFGPRVGLWAVALVLTTNILWELGTDQRSDGFLALYVVTAAQCAAVAFRDPRRLGAVPLLGMSMGLAFATKLTGLLAIGLFGGITVLVLLRTRPERWGRWLALGVLCTAVPGGFWVARNAVELGNPIYPFPDQLLYHDAAGKLRPFYPDFEPLYARSEKPPANFLKDPGGQKEPGSILNVVDLFLDPDRYQNKDFHWLQPLLFLAVLVPLVDRRPRYLWLWGAGLLCFVGLGLRAHLVRYAVPAYPLLALGAGAVLAHPRVRRMPAVSWCALLLTAGIAVHNHAWEWVKLTGSQSAKIKGLWPLDYLSGRQSAYEWKVRHGYNADTRSSVAAHKINQLIAEGKLLRSDTLLMIAESKADLLQCNAIPDVSAEAYSWLTEFLRGDGDYDRIRANLLRSGITHLLLNEGHLGWIVAQLKMNSRLQNLDYLRFSAFHALRFAQAHGTLLLKDNRVWLYRINPT